MAVVPERREVVISAVRASRRRSNVRAMMAEHCFSL
jgi:hypothetical protein